MIHDVGAIAKKCGLPGILSGRKATPAVRERIEAEFSDIRKGGVELLDFSKIEIVDYSAADEVVAKIAGRMEGGEYGEGTIVLAGCNEPVRESLEIALRQKDFCLMIVEGRKKWDVIGELNPYLRETLNLCMRSGKLLARDLASELKLKLNTSSTRLINLFAKHLVLRKEDPETKIGREYTYCSPLADLPT